MNSPGLYAPAARLPKHAAGLFFFSLGRQYFCDFVQQLNIRLLPRFLASFYVFLRQYCRQSCKGLWLFFHEGQQDFQTLLRHRHRFRGMLHSLQNYALRCQ